jgi:hypothetical protein
MSFEGTIVNGNAVLDEPSSLPEGTRVDVQVKNAGAEAPTLGFLLKYAGRIKDMPADFATEHDHYIHGTPRRKPESGE